MLPLRAISTAKLGANSPGKIGNTLLLVSQRTILWVSACLLIFGALPPRAVGALTASQNRFADAVVPTSARGHPLGRLAATEKLRLAIALPLRKSGELANLVQRLYDPASPDYHQYLTPVEFAARYCPGEAEYQQVIAFAERAGLTIAARHRSRLVLELAGTVDVVEQAFQTRLQTYQHPTEPRRFFAPETAPVVAEGLPVLEIRGLSDWARPRHFSQPQPARPRPVAAIGSAPGGNYMGQDFRQAYVPGVTLDGTGQMVGLVEFDGYQAADIAAYESLAGLPAVPLINVPIHGFNTAGAGSSEVSLDIEMAISMAPGLAAVVVFQAPADGSGTLALLDNLAASNQIRQFSCSWGLGSGVALDAAFLRLAAQGQTLLMASGDSGAYVQPQSVWTESPYATSVGGTRLTMSGAAAAYEAETVWQAGNTSSSGGVSAVYPLPAWQQGLSLNANPGSGTGRNLPDVALTAESVWVTYGGGRAGAFQGTSCAAPLWAGFIALVNQQSLSTGNPPVGFLNPGLYLIARGANYANCFHDITLGNNTSSLSPSNYYAGPGYDLCTGLGSPGGSNLINALTSLTFPPSLTAQPQSLLVDQGANAVFQVGISGTAPLTCQWQFNGANLPGATNATLTIPHAQATDAGTYAAQVSSPYGSVKSAAATLTIVQLPAGTLGDGTNLAVLAGGNAAFSVSATGTGPFTYQWQFNGTNLPNNLIGTVAGSGVTGFAGDGGAATNAALFYPGSLAGDHDGNLYVADSNNSRIRKVGTNGIMSTVAGRGIASFSGDGGFATNASLNHPQAVAVDAAGNVYIADTGNHRVRRLTANGLIMTVAGGAGAGFAGDGGAATNASLGAPSGLAFAPDGSLHIADQAANRIRKVDPNGIITTVAGNGNATFAGDGGPATNAALNGPQGLALDAGGNLLIADSLNNRIRRVDRSGLIATIAGTSGSGYAGDGAAAAKASLADPRGVCGDLLGNLYIADANNQRIRRIDPTGIITTVAGNGSGGFFGDGGPPLQANLRLPAAVAMDPQGNLLVADYGNSRIRKVLLYAGYSTLDLNQVGAAQDGNYTVVITSPYGSVTSGVARLTVDLPPVINTHPVNQLLPAGNTTNLTVAASGTGPLQYLWYFAATNLIQSGTNRSLLLAGISPAQAGEYRVVVTNAFGRATSQVATITVWIPPSTTPIPASQVVEEGANVSFGVAVTALGPLSYQWQFNGTNLPNNLLTTVAGSGSGGPVSDHGPALAAALNGPSGVAIDAFNNLFIADNANNRICQVDPGGNLTTIAGNGIAGFSGDGGPATGASLNGAFGVTLDAAGNLYVADIFNFRIRQIDPAGIITTLAGNGAFGFSGEGGAATAASLREPTAVIADATGNVYFSDNLNGRVRKVDATGIIATVAGAGGGGFSGDGGPATNATLISPRGLALDAQGNLFIADYGNSRIRKVSNIGLITTVAGRGTNGFSGDGGWATNASLFFPSGVAVDGFGDLYIADQSNNRIRRVDTNGLITTVAGAGAPGFMGDGGRATNASLWHPSAVALDKVGNLYVADYGNNRIRKVALAAGYPRLDLVGVGTTNSGQYRVVITSPYYSVTSAVATLTVLPARRPPSIAIGAAGWLTVPAPPGYAPGAGSNRIAILEMSRDLRWWIPLATNQPDAFPFYYQDLDWTNFPWRFYRARWP